MISNFKFVPLEEILESYIGGLWGDAPGQSEIDVKVMRITELGSNGKSNPSTAAVRSVSAKQLASRKLNTGDLVLEKSGGGPNTPVGRVALIEELPEDFICSNFMLLMRPDESVVQSRYLHHFLTYLHLTGQTIPLQSSSTNIRNINTPDYMQIEVPLPLLDVQNRIVEALDDQLSRLDKALAEVEAVMLKFETLERSSLEANFQGVLDSEHAKSFPLSAVTDKVKSLDPKTLGVHEIKYVDIGSISADLENPRIENSTVAAAAPSRARQHLKSGDVVFSTVRPYQKKIALIDDDLDGQIASTGFCVLRPTSGVLDTRYLFHYLKSDMLLDQVLPLQRGASYPAVGDSDVKQATIPVPGIETQRVIANTLDSVVGTIKAQKNQMQSIIEIAQTLRRSLLHKAFTGELLEEK